MEITGDLRAINSMTKYPSIETFHKIDPKNGQLQEEINVDFGDVGNIYVTEKIDGTNARILLFPDNDWIIGSREELLCARGDRIMNPALGIVAALKPIVERLVCTGGNAVYVAYGEVYGGNIGKSARNYTGDRGEYGFRLFDLVTIPMTQYHELVAQPVEQIAAWRDAGGQQFSAVDDLMRSAFWWAVPMVPYIVNEPNASALPGDIAGMLAYLREVLPHTTAGLNNAVVPGNGEGVVIRTGDRSKIAKIRFEDYERTLRKRK